MTKADLLTSFRSCKRYKQAPRWQKPWLNPGRFIRNQLNKHHIHTYEPAELRKIDAFHMHRFTIVNGEGVGEQIASYGIYEESLTEAFLRLVKPGQSVVDVGMHLGYYTTLFAVLWASRDKYTRSSRLLRPARWRAIISRDFISNSACVRSGRPYAESISATTDPWMAFSSFTNQVVDKTHGTQENQVETTTLDQFRDGLEQDRLGENRR
jgi:hypothetical protein